LARSVLYGSPTGGTQEAVRGRDRHGLSLGSGRVGARTTEERGSHGDAGSAPRRNDKPGPATARTSEWFDEVHNLRRVGSLARDQPGSRFGDTLRSSRAPVSHGGRESSRGEDPGSRVPGREREDPEEGKPQEGSGPCAGVTPGRCATDSQGEQGPGGGPWVIRMASVVRRAQGKRQEGSGRREAARLPGREKP